MPRSTFAGRPPSEKRVITVSVTTDQDDEFERLKAATGHTTDGGVIKQALAELATRVWGWDPKDQRWNDAPSSSPEAHDSGEMNRG